MLAYDIIAQDTKIPLWLRGDTSSKDHFSPELYEMSTLVVGIFFFCFFCAQSLFSPTQSTNKTSVFREVIKYCGMSNLPGCQKDLKQK